MCKKEIEMKVKKAIKLIDQYPLTYAKLRIIDKA